MYVSATNIDFGGLRDRISNVNVMSVNVEGRQISIVYFNPATSSICVTTKWLTHDQYQNPFMVVTSGGTFVA